MLRRFCKELGRETGPFFLQNRLLSDVSQLGRVFVRGESPEIGKVPLEIVLSPEQVGDRRDPDDSKLRCLSRKPHPALSGSKATIRS